MTASSHGRVPNAGHDPIRSPLDAMQVFALQVTRPLRPETLVMLIDRNGCGISLITVSDTTEPDQVVDVADAMAMALVGRPQVGGLVLATVRPGGHVLADDDALWFEAAAAIEAHGLVLYDWLIIGRGGTVSMTHELGVPSRWPGRT